MNFLKEVIDKKKKEIREKKKKLPIERLIQRISGWHNPRDFASAIRDGGIVAEVKKATPLKGFLKENIDTVFMAKKYEAGGAKAISVLTEREFFHGSDEDLTSVKQAVNLPIMRKDFILEEYQVYESRMLGADAVLLISSLLSTKILKKIIELVRELGMTDVVEVHDEKDIEKTLAVKPRVLGLNNRNLKTLEVSSFETCLSLRKKIYSPEMLIMAESGIKSREDIIRLQDGGINIFLIGEALILSDSPEKKLRELYG